MSIFVLFIAVVLIHTFGYREDVDITFMIMIRCFLLKYICLSKKIVNLKTNIT